MGQCGSALRKPCLSDDDVRYDSTIPQEFLAQDPRWEKLQGYFKLEAFAFDVQQGTARQPIPFFRPGTENQPYDTSKITAWYNHTFDGSRFYIHRHYLNAPAPESFCSIPSFPQGGTNHSGDGTCGVNGFGIVAGAMFSLTHENDASMEQVMSYGQYSSPLINSQESYMTIVDDSAFNSVSTVAGIWSSAASFIFFDDDNAVFQISHTNLIIDRMEILAGGTLTRVTEAEYIAGLYNGYEEFNVPEISRSTVPLLSDEAIPGSYPNETAWCGGIVNDAGCTESPYVEPDPQFTNGAIAMFVIIGGLAFTIIAYYIHKYFLNKQKDRIQLRMIRGIAQNVTIAPSAGQMDADTLLKEFRHMDKDKGGTISRDECKKWLSDGKLGEINDRDFNAMWVAMDTDGSGEVDFVEFASYLSACGDAFNEVFNELQNMSKDDMLKRSSQRLSVIQLSKEDVEALKKLDEGDEADEEKN